jgi:hypothetical protein
MPPVAAPEGYGYPEPQSTSTAERPAEVAPQYQAYPTNEVSNDVPPAVTTFGNGEPTQASEGATIAVGPRWVAEEVPLQGDESSVILENEMHKAHAAFAAADYASTYQAAPVDRSDEPLFATMAPPAIGEPVPAESDSPEPENQAAVEVSIPAPPVEAYKPAPPPFAPAKEMAIEESQHAVAAFGTPQPFGMESHVGPTEEPAKPEPVIKAAEEQRESEIAAATAAVSANWNEVRESMAKAASAAGELARELDQRNDEKPAEEAVKPEAAAMAAAAAGDSSGTSPADPNLSTLVDSMLAELKPKLMAELAKKLEKK